jgi:hypothetical protein
MVRTYIVIGDTVHAKNIIEQLWTRSSQYMNYYCTLNPTRFNAAQNDCMFHMYILNHLSELTGRIDEKQAKKYETQLAAIAEKYQGKGGRF